MRYTQRIFWPQYSTSERLERLLEFLKGHRGLADEISFFTEGDGRDWRYVPIEEVRRRAGHLGRAVQRAREEGFTPVINILNTLGHSDEGGETAPTPPWQTMVGLDGSHSKRCSCPANADFLAYVRAKYEAYGKSGAVRYWIDDDVRFRHHAPVQWGCFCDGCLGDFFRQEGAPFVDSTGVPGLADFRIRLEGDLPLRKAWVERSERVFLALIQACAEGVVKGNPAAEVGLMTGELTHDLDSGGLIERRFKTLSCVTGRQSWIRTGGGFWSEGTPRSLLNKLQNVSHVVGRLPARVGTTYEIENYPFCIGTKGASATGWETLLAVLSNRFDGILFDVLDLAGNPLHTRESWMEQLGVWLPLWKKASQCVSGTLPVGWMPVFSLGHFYQEPHLDKAFHFRLPYPQEWHLAGLPFTGFAEAADGWILNKSAAEGATLEELKGWLRAPLIMDGGAAAVYVARGLGEAIGVKAMTGYCEGASEVFTDHPLNGANAGFSRSFSMAYFGAEGVAFEVDSRAEVLSLAERVDRSLLGVSSYLFTPEGGATIAVSGHAAWMHVLSPEKMGQIRALSNALLPAHRSLPYEGDSSVAFWLREGKGKRIGIWWNAAFDPATLHLTVPTGRLEVATSGCTLEGRQLTIPSFGVAVVMF